MSQRLANGIDPVIAAAVISFGFVFLHPSEKRNGRIHRFPVHEVLSDREFTPEETLFPVSAAILGNRQGCDRCLEAFSAAANPHVDWKWGMGGILEVWNETADPYRYFDSTPQIAYLFGRIQNTIHVDLRQELNVIHRFDHALQAVCRIIDMPDRRARLFIQLALQNNGKLPAWEMYRFKEIENSEMDAMEVAIRDAVAFNPSGNAAWNPRSGRTTVTTSPMHGGAGTGSAAS